LKINNTHKLLTAKSEVLRRRFTMDEYYRLTAAGILPARLNTELIEGEIIEMSPVGTPHSSYVVRLTRLLILALDDKAVVSSQNPMQLGKNSQPEPDIMVLKSRTDNNAEANPEPKDVLLLIEVSESSLD
jgi:Uma2 family endonuclease